MASSPAEGAATTLSTIDASVAVGGVAEPGAVDVTLATLVLEGLGKGTSVIVIEVVRFDDDDGFPIPAEVIAGSVRVKKGPARPGAENRLKT